MSEKFTDKRAEKEDKLEPFAELVAQGLIFDGSLGQLLYPLVPAQVYGGLLSQESEAVTQSGKQVRSANFRLDKVDSKKVRSENEIINECLELMPAEKTNHQAKHFRNTSLPTSKSLPFIALAREIRDENRAEKSKLAFTNPAFVKAQFKGFSLLRSK